MRSIADYSGTLSPFRMAYSANMTVCRQERLQSFTQLKYLSEDKGLQLIYNMADG